MPRRVAPRRVARLQTRFLRNLGATPQEIRRWRPVLTAQIGAESNFTQGVGSPAGARDIAQFMPGTAPSYGVTLGDGRIKDDIRGQVRYMLPLLRKYGAEDALRGYNAGPGAIDESRGYSETNAYVQRVLGSRGQYRFPNLAAGGGAPGPGPSSPGGGGSSFQLQAGPDLSALLTQLQQRQATPPATGALPDPAFSARAGLAMPAGALELDPGRAPVPKDDTLADLLGAIETQASVPGVLGGGDAQNGGGGGQGGGGAAGRNDRVAGHSAETVVDDLADWAHQHLGIGPGSRDRSEGENAAAGGSSDSDHLEGGGRSRGREALDRPTPAAAGGWKQYRQIAKRFGLTPDAGGFTQGTIKVGNKKFRVQVIFGSANDHGDHIHVGIRRA